MADIKIIGSAIVRQAQFEPSNTTPPTGYRIVARWLLSSEDKSGASVGGLLPRVIWDGTQFVPDKFQLRLFMGTGPARKFFDPAVGDFVINDTAILCEPLLEAIIRPPATVRDFSAATDSLKLLCATDERTSRAQLDGRLFHEGLTSHFSADTVSDTESLNIRDILMGAEPASARYMQARALFLAFRAETQSFVDGRGAAIIRAVLPKEKQDRLGDILDAESSDRRAARLTQQCLAGAHDEMVDPARILRECQKRRDNHAETLRSGEALNSADLYDLVDLTITMRALTNGEEATTFLRALLAAKDEAAAARESLILSAAHGGRWFIYDPRKGETDPLTTIKTDCPIGQAFASDLVGLGYISPLIQLSTIQNWPNLPIGMRIDAVPAPDPLLAGLGAHQDDAAFAPSADALIGRYFVAGDTRTYQPFEIGDAILAKELGDLVANGQSTRPLVAPDRSELFLDQVSSGFVDDTGADETDAKKRKDEDQFNRPTNDTLIRLWLRSKAVADPYNRRQIPGFNIYAQWRGANDGTTVPSLRDLQPFLVNTRTSFLTDIFHAFKLDDLAKPLPDRVQALADFPAGSPIVPRPTEVEMADTLSELLAPTDPEIKEEILPTADVYLALDKKWAAETRGFSSWVSMDLRQGTLLPNGGDWSHYAARLDALKFRWDPNSPIDPALVGCDGLRPKVEKYRFFATTVDMFGQESQPALIDCSTAFFQPSDASTLYPGEYRPRMRRTLPPPPGSGGGNESDAIPLIYDAANDVLRLKFETPFRDQAGQGGVTAREPHAHLQARVRVYRRFIQGEIEGLPPLPLLRASGPFASGAEIDELDAGQAAHGFHFFNEILENAPVSGDVWEASITSPGATAIAPIDHGYEYRAAIRFEVKPPFLSLYFPDELQRSHFKVTGSAGADLADVVQPEIVTRGTFGISGRASCLDATMIVAPSQVVTQSFTPVKQIGPAGIVSRDLVLSKLLSLQVQNEASAVWPAGADWAGRRYRASRAQSKIMEAALVRAGLDHTASNRPFIDLLMREFAPFDTAIAPALSGSTPPSAMSLAGIIGLRGYVSLSWQTPDSNNVRPNEFQIYLTRRPPAPPMVNARSGATQSELVWTVRAEADPAMVYAFTFPVPGGPAETLEWSVVARSAAGFAATALSFPEQTFGSSLVPSPVRNIDVTAVEPGPGDVMPASASAALLPRPIRKLSGYDRDRALAQAPRLKIQWDVEPEPGISIAVVKMRESWTAGARRKTSDPTEPFEAVLERIARLRPDDKISPQDLDRSELAEWLAGDLDVGLPASLSEMFIPAAGRLLPSVGLDPTARPWFVDYFHDCQSGETPSESVMEYDHRYSYKLAAYRDIEAVTGTPTARIRRLYSDFTEFSPSTPPVIPEWHLPPLPAAHRVTSLGLLPTLRFQIEVEDARPTLDLQTVIAFHVMVVRKLDEHQVALGRPIILRTSSTASATIDAGEILRPRRGAPVVIDCLLQVGAFLESADGLREPLNSSPLTPLKIEIPTPTTADELAVEQKIIIKLGRP